MKNGKIRLPVIIFSVLLAFISIGFLGRTHILSRLFGTVHLPLIADAGFFLFTLFYGFLLWQARQYLPVRFFGFCLWGLILICLFILF